MLGPRAPCAQHSAHHRSGPPPAFWQKSPSGWVWRPVTSAVRGAARARGWWCPAGSSGARHCP
eukprot:CAMPEP_0171229462 /NCGR_PEP_ID=MMETSP0790-20130122/38893_1 /TAXON_ID=2925 /ORGANISM="Alexandrium catenella, Strain OF101" /LENGTH=62 /DNA_ID=CAMNT_0011695643 /DNA_START=111 /DNA_END=295 /DNA_ORIENTATION=-